MDAEHPRVSHLCGNGPLGRILVAVNNRFRELEVADIVGRSGAKLLVIADAGTTDTQGLLAKIARRDLPDPRT